MEDSDEEVSKCKNRGDALEGANIHEELQAIG
jgi:hypothetical protein